MPTVAGSLSTSKKPRPWTDEEDKLLQDATLPYIIAEEEINWKAVAALLVHRTNKDCRKRWVYSSAPWIRKGRWSSDEDARLGAAVGMLGTKWSEVCIMVEGRQPDQCSRRWHEVLKPDIDRGRWSLLEDQVLRNAVRAHGRSWIEIIERYFPRRTPIMARTRYRQLIRIDEHNTSHNNHPDNSKQSATHSD